MRMTIDIVPEAWGKYVGTRPVHDEDIPRRRAASMAFSLVAECMCAPESPHWRMARNGLQLCDETESHLYEGTFGHVEEPYRPGSRPILEAYVQEALDGVKQEHERALAILRAAHVDRIQPRFGSVPVFLYGESDEQTLLKGGGHCSCRSRMLSAMYQIAGLEARPLMFWVIRDPSGRMEYLGGHTVVEVLVDGAWAFVDPLPGLYVPSGPGRLASIKDIREDPKLLTGLDPALQREIGVADKRQDGLSFVQATAHRYFQPHVPTLISRHDVNAPYRGTWNWATDEFRRKQEEDYAFYREFLADLAEKGELTDEVYAMGQQEFRAHFDLTDLKLPVPVDAFEARG